MHTASAFALVVVGTLLLGASAATAAFEATNPGMDLVAPSSLAAVVGAAALAAGILGRASSRSTRRT